jgi:hypothetical protein
MNDAKIENYERQHGVGTFIPFRHLSKEDAATVFRLLKRRLELPDDAEGLRVVEVVEAKSFTLDGVNAEREDFDLKHVLRQLQFDVPDIVYLNWNRFDDIDEIRVTDLFRAFDDLWYPSADDLDIFDTKLNWILSIAHYGAVSALRLGTG